MVPRDTSKFYLVGALVCFLQLGCSREDDAVTVEERKPGPVASQLVQASALPTSQPRMQLLYLPDGGDVAPPRAPGQGLLPGPWGMPSGRCPPDMVDVRGSFCIDRYESTLLDVAEERRVSPYYHPTRHGTRNAYSRWSKQRLEIGSETARRVGLPSPPTWQMEEEFRVKASSRPSSVPNGYLNLGRAREACANAGKRLCRAEEWVRACRGEQDRKFPYGDSYVAGKCNVFRSAHPAAELHDDASVGHLDPRLNQVRVRGDRLLHKTGETPLCKSDWGADAVYDMVGNLDEWIDDSGGVFLGGFYSRNTREGCAARISSHGPSYFDYSLGVRCCR